MFVDGIPGTIEVQVKVRNIQVLRYSILHKGNPSQRVIEVIIIHEVTKRTAQIRLQHIQLPKLIIPPQPLPITLRFPQLPPHFILTLRDPFLIKQVQFPPDLVSQLVFIERFAEAADEEVAEGYDAAYQAEDFVEFGGGYVVGMHFLGVGERNVEPETSVGTVVVEAKPLLVVGLEAVGYLVEGICLPISAIVVGDVGLGKGHVGLHGEKRVQPSEVREEKGLHLVFDHPAN